MVVLGHDLRNGDAVSAFDLSYGAYLIGTMGTGKSTVLQRMVLDDLDRGRGFVLLDPHRQLVETILASVPSTRAEALTVIDMTDNPPGFGINLFDCDDPTDELALSQTAELFVATFRQALSDTSTTWGALLDGLLYNIAYVVAANPGTGLPDVPKLLRDDRYRSDLLTRVANEIVLDYWQGEYAEMSDRSRAREIGSTMRRLRSFITNPLLNQIFRVPKTTIDFRWLMDAGPGLLVALDPNQPHASNLIGALMLAKIKRHTFERDERAENRPFHVYADEFQKFTTTDFDRFWGESRKFNVGVIAAHQFRNQLTPELRSASASVGTRIVFSVNHEDASDLGRMFTLPKMLGEPEFKAVVEDIVEPATMEWYWDPADAPQQIEQYKAEIEATRVTSAQTYNQVQSYNKLFHYRYDGFPRVASDRRTWDTLSEKDILDLSWIANPRHHSYLDEATIKAYLRQYGTPRRLGRWKTVPVLPRSYLLVTVPLTFVGKPIEPMLHRLIYRHIVAEKRTCSELEYAEEVMGTEFYAEFLAQCWQSWTTDDPLYRLVLPDERDLALMDGELKVLDKSGTVLRGPSEIFSHQIGSRVYTRPGPVQDVPWSDFFIHEREAIAFRPRTYSGLVAWLARRVGPQLDEWRRQLIANIEERKHLEAEIARLRECRKQRIAKPPRVIGHRYKKDYIDGYRQTVYDYQRGERTMTAGEFARHLASQPPFQAHVKTNLGQWEIKTVPPPARTGTNPAPISHRSRELFAPRMPPATNGTRKPIEAPAIPMDNTPPVREDRPRPAIIKRRPDS